MKRRAFFSIVLIILVASGIANCRRGMFIRKGPSPITDVEGKTYFTQIGMWSEHGEHETTNYARGRFLPVNSKVRILSTSSRTIRVRVIETDRTFKIVNIEDYTKRGIKNIFDRYFGKSKVDLSQFNKKVREQIKTGRLRHGMSKKAVLLTRGYPPAHRTPSTEENKWIYWTSRFNKKQVTFEDGKVINIKD